MCNSDEISRFSSFSYRNGLIALGALIYFWCLEGELLFERGRLWTGCFTLFWKPAECTKQSVASSFAWKWVKKTGKRSKKQLVNFPPWVFSMTIPTSEVIRLKEFCTHIGIIVERLWRRPVFFQEINHGWYFKWTCTRTVLSLKIAVIDAWWKWKYLQRNFEPSSNYDVFSAFQIAPFILQYRKCLHG